MHAKVSEGKSQADRRWLRLGDKIKFDLEKTGFEVVDWIVFLWMRFRCGCL